jgi:inorganic pyrophosphatase
MTLSAGSKPPSDINVYIEIPQDSSIKYELDKDSGVLTVDRFLHTAMSYPFNYGFIPSTHAKDGDPVDVLVISSRPVQAGVVIPCQPIGLLEMEDEAGIDTKILAVPPAKIDPEMANIDSIDKLPESLKNKVKHFFEHYKDLEPGKWVKIKEWKNKAEALKDITESLR